MEVRVREMTEVVVEVGVLVAMVKILVEEVEEAEEVEEVEQVEEVEESLSGVAKWEGVGE